MEDVEQHCRKLFVGAVKWSPAFTEDTEKVQMWYMLSDFMHDKTVNWRRLQSLRKRCEPQPTLSSYMALSLVNIHEGTTLYLELNTAVTSQSLWMLYSPPLPFIKNNGILSSNLQGNRVTLTYLMNSRPRLVYAHG